jgi:hypothetical protein
LMGMGRVGVGGLRQKYDYEVGIRYVWGKVSER